MFRFKINKLTTNTTDKEKVIIPKTVNVIIGPNNSGKSRFLKELRNFLNGDKKDLKIIDKVDYEYPENFTTLNESYDIQSKISKDYYGNLVLRTYAGQIADNWDINASMEIYSTKNLNSINTNWKDYFEDIINNKEEQVFFSNFGALFYQYLGTEERLIISKIQKNYGLDSANTNFLSTCKFEDSLLKGLSERVKNIFGKDIILDTQTLGDRLVFRVGENFDYIKGIFGNDQEEISNLLKENILDEQGDGLKSFVSTYLALNLKEKDVLLLDEPEAFLHPPLARQMGEMIGEVKNGKKQIYIATHSVEVLKGILSKCDDINIIRITQPRPNINEITLIDNTTLINILNNPLLRVSRILEGLFCEKVVLTEAESDELIYQEIIEKIWPQSGLYFTHGHNKQILADIAELYGKIGVPYEIIVDFDILRKNEEFNNFLKVFNLSLEEKNKYLDCCVKLRDLINSKVGGGLTEEEKNKAQRKERDRVYHELGVPYLSNADNELKNNIEELLEKMHIKHLHILPSGELETLLVPFGIKYTHNKKKWVEDAIKYIAKLEKEKLNNEDQLVKFLKRIVGEQSTLK